MIILSASMPLMNGESFGTLDHHVVKFSAILYLVQIMAGLTQTDPKPDSEDTEVLRLAKSVSEIIGSSDTLGPNLANTVRKAMLHFLRCAAMFYHFITEVPLPNTRGGESDKEIYEILSNYLSLPKSLSDLIKEEDTFNLVSRLLQNEALKNIQCCQMPPLKRRLIDLPNDFMDLLNKAAHYECKSGKSASVKNKSSAICLTCGHMLCVESNCCRGEIANQKVGGCTLHSQKCGSGVGLFLNPNRCELLILFQRHKGK